MIDIQENISGDFEVKFQYKPFLVEAIKQIPGRYYAGERKVWVIPAKSKDALFNWAKHFGPLTVDKQTPAQVGEIEELPELTVDIPLLREPFPYQRNGIAYAIDKRRCIFGDQPGLGKAQPLTAKIATPSGWTIMRDAYVGMQVLGADGKNYEVNGVFPQGVKPCYRITFNDETVTECCGDHLWSVRDVNRRRKNRGWITKTTSELLASGLKYIENPGRTLSGRKQILKWEIPIAKPFHGQFKKFVIDPYIMGVLLGDGSMCGKDVAISIPDFEIETKDRVEKLLPSNLKLWMNKYSSCPQYNITQTGTTNKNPFMTEIKNLGLHVKGKEKFIPETYRFASLEQRWELLKGLMDTDGSAKRNRITYHTCSLKLANDIAELVASLGGQAIIRKYDRSHENKGFEWQVNIRVYENPFHMKRKAEQWWIAKRNYPSKYIQSIEYIGEKEQQCISVTAPDHLYLTDHFIVTHNTGQAIAATIGVQSKCILVICPATLRENWKREWKIWTGRDSLILTDRIKTTWPTYYNIGMINVFIVNYESLKKYFVEKIDRPKDEKGKEKPLRLNHIHFKETTQLFDTVIIDESHRCKDGRTQQSKFVMGISRSKPNIFALTGTPVVNKPIDLIPQLTIINRLGDFGGYTGFKNRYCQGSNEASNLRELNYLLHQKCFFRREKKDVLKDLPDKMRNIIRCEIENRAEYQKAENDLVKYLKENMGKTDAEITKSMRGEVMVLIQILKKISARGKINDVLEHIQEVVDAGEKIVVFAHHKEIVQALKNVVKGAVTIVGDDSMDQRQHAVDSFQRDPKTQVIICNIKSGGVGITLTASSRVCFIELPWHPADCDQCEDRCHRIGQKDSVQCTYFLGHETIDQYIYSIIENKRKIANEVTGAREEIETNVVDEFINLFMKEKVEK